MNGLAISAELRRYGPAANGEAPEPAAARAYCRNLARSHYENFSVVSRLLPRRHRQHFCHVYAYCRWADDLADEVHDPQRSRELLDWWQEQLDACYAGHARHPVFVALRETIGEYPIPRQPFADLLSAFRQDQQQHRYETFDDLLDYCRRSADPVGRIILCLAGSREPSCCEWSDAICTGLQLANFCQDVARDYQRGRIYLPLESCRRFGYDESGFERGLVNAAWRELLRHEVERAESFLERGRPLVDHIDPDFSRQVRLFLGGGLLILRQIRAAGYDVWSRRPTVSRRAKLGLLLNAWTAGRRKG